MMLAALKRFAQWFFLAPTVPQSPYAKIVEGTAAHATKKMLEAASPFLVLDKFNEQRPIQSAVKFRRLRSVAADELFEPLQEEPFTPIIPEPQATDYRRECIAKALYDHWAEENELCDTYVCWRMLPDKATWYNRADAVIAADPKEKTP